MARGATAMGEARREQIHESTYDVLEIKEGRTSFSSSGIDPANRRHRACLSREVAARIGAKVGDRVVLRTTVEVEAVRDEPAKPPERRPDALLIPCESIGVFPPYERLGMATVATAAVRVVSAIAEPLLGVDRGAGERVYVRVTGAHEFFVSKDPRDTILFPADGPRRGEPRYEWTGKPDGIQMGYLLDRCGPVGAGEPEPASPPEPEGSWRTRPSLL